MPIARRRYRRAKARLAKAAARLTGDNIEGPSNQQANQDNPGSVQEQTPGREITVSPYNTVESHRHWGVFLNRSRTHPIRLLTTALIRYEGDDFGEKRFVGDFGGNLCEFRVWSPFQSKLAAGIMNGLSDLHLKSGANVLYLGAGFGHTVSYVSDIIGESGMVYAVEQGPWAARQLTTLANRRPNVVPVMEDASMPYKYRHQVPAGIDIIFCDLPLSDQVRCLMLNARHYLSIGGYFLVFVRANILEPNVANTLALEKERLKQHQLEPLEEVLLDPFMPGFALVAGVYTREVPRD